MRNILQKLQQKHMSEIADELAPLYYRYKRYGHKCSALLLYSSTSLEHGLVKETIRLTDHSKRLEDELIFIIFEEAEISDAIRAAEKLLSILRNSSPEDIYVSVEECTDKHEGESMVRELFSLLDFSMEHNHSNEVIDKSYFDGVY